MTELLKFMVTLPADVLPRIEQMVTIQQAVGDFKSHQVQIAAAIALAAHKENASHVGFSTFLPGLAVVLMPEEEAKPDCTCGPCEPTCDHTDPEVCNSFCKRHPDTFHARTLDSLEFSVMPPDGISVNCTQCLWKSGGNTLHGQGIRLAIKMVLEHVEEKHG